jgi:TonB-linked SusC/RagA family outer membrane protein
MKFLFAAGKKQFPCRRLKNNNGLLMKVSCLLSAVTCTSLQFLIANEGTGQDISSIKVTLELKSESLKTVFKKIERQTDFRFAYNRQQVEDYKNLSLQRAQYSVKQVLDLVLNNTGLAFRQINNNIIIFTSETNEAIAITKEPATVTMAREDGSIKGKVTNEKGEPVAAASVILVGSDKGTAANNTGEFTIAGIKAGKYRLQITALGYQTYTQAIIVKDDEVLQLNFQLQLATAALDEVVVTGYSRQSKRDVTGAVSTIPADVIAQTPVSDISSALKGRVAGVSVDEQGGPGSPGVVRIRGFGTLGNNDPLYVIDGVQMRGSNNLINPNNIETITILKDPSITSLYGAEGSNGVIVITTKRGKNGPPRLEYNTYAGTEIPLKYPGMLTPQQYADAYWQYLANSGLAQSNLFYGNGSKPVLPDYIIETQSGTPIVVKPGDPAPDPALYNPGTYRILKTNKEGTDWFREILNQSFTQNHQLAFSGATEKSNYALTFNYNDNKGVVLKTFFRRYSVRVNTDFKIKPWLRAGENMEFSYSEGSSINNHSTNNVMSDLYRRTPLMPIYDIAGNYSGPKGIPDALALHPGGNNPIFGQMNGYKNSKGFNSGIIGSAFVDAEPINGLVLETKIGIQLYPYQYRYFLDTFPQNIYSGVYNSFTEGGGYSLDWRWTNKLSYETRIKDIHKISAFVAYEARRFSTRFNSGTTPNLPYTTPSYLYLGGGVPIDSIGLHNLVSGGGDLATNVSVFGNLNYTLLDRYLLSVVVRRDGSSKFGTFNQYGTFPSVSAGWRISDEKFMGNINWLDELKLRVAAGTNGNDAIPSGLTVNQYSSNTYTSSYDLGGNNNSASTGFGLYQIGNPYLKWEINKTTNIGFDAAFLQNRFTASFNWYNRITDDLLYQPPATGLQGDALAPYENILKFSNKGIELELGYNSQKRGQFRYEVNFNIATYRNKVLFINKDTTAFISGDNYQPTHFSMNRSVVGMPVASFFGYVHEGTFQTIKEVQDHATQAGIDKTNPETGLGHFKFRDVNKDGVINEGDRTFIGNPHPKFTYGLNVNLYYGQFDCNIFVEGVTGNKIFNYWRAYTRWPGALGEGSDDTWSPANTGAALPVWEAGAATDNVPSSFFIENGSYLRIKNVQIGYNFSKIKGFSKCRVYAQAYNLVTFKKYTGLDPQISKGSPGSPGVDFGGNYPIAMKILFGVNIGL